MHGVFGVCVRVVADRHLMRITGEELARFSFTVQLSCGPKGKGSCADGRGSVGEVSESGRKTDFHVNTHFFARVATTDWILVKSGMSELRSFRSLVRWLGMDVTDAQQNESWACVWSESAGHNSVYCSIRPHTWVADAVALVALVGQWRMRESHMSTDRMKSLSGIGRGKYELVIPRSESPFFDDLSHGFFFCLPECSGRCTSSHLRTSALDTSHRFHRKMGLCHRALKQCSDSA